MERKQIRKIERELRNEGNKEAAGIVAEYYRLRFQYIPQLLAHLEPKGCEQNFPHKMKPKDKLHDPETVEKIAQGLRESSKNKT